MKSIVYASKFSIAAIMLVVSSVLMAEWTLAAKPQSPAVTGIVDSTGKAVGKLVGTFRFGMALGTTLFYTDIALQVNGYKFIATVDRSTWYGNSDLYFVGANCEGQAYFWGPGIATLPIPAIQISPTSQLAYISSPTATPTTVFVTSKTLFTGVGLATTCESNPIPLGDAIEAINVGNLNTIYAPPFTLQVAP